MGQALEGIRVIDFTHDQAGPACTQMLAWLGADVIKIERPPHGDRARRLWFNDNPEIDSFFFLLLNSNKRSIVLDLKTAEGKEVAMQEAVLNLTRVKFTPQLATGKPLARTGNRSLSGAYADIIRCAPRSEQDEGVNEYVYLMLPPDSAQPFEAMTEIIGRLELR